jgi:hypothetical protein
MSGRRIMTADEIRRATIRLSHEIVEKQAGTDGLILIGIQRRGVPLARRIAAAIAEHEGGAEVEVGALDITFYRDDLSMVAQQPVVKGTELPSGIDGKTIVLVDDVTSDDPRRSAWPCSWIAAIASSRSVPTTSARMSRRRVRSSFVSILRRPMARTVSRSNGSRMHRWRPSPSDDRGHGRA